MWSVSPPNATVLPAAVDLALNGTLDYSMTAIMTTVTVTSNATAKPIEETSSLDGRSTAEVVVWSIFLTLIIVIAILGNLLVVVCVRNTARLRSEKSNMFLVNLSITDIGSACVVMTSSLHAMAADQWHLGSAWCDLVCGANYAFIIVSMLTLCFISLDRYAAVVYALRYHSWVTRRIISMLIAWAWFQGFCFGLAPVLANWVRYDYWEVVCAIVWHEDTSNTLTYVTVAFIVCFLMPGVVLAVAYCKIIKVAKAQNNIHPHDTRLMPNPGVIRSDMLTSAGSTNERPGISIITDVQDQTMTTNLQGNEHPRASPGHANTFYSQYCNSSPELGTTPMQSSNKNSTHEALGFDLPAQRMYSTSEFNGFPVSRKRLQCRLEQYKDETANANACITAKISRNASMNDIKAGYPGKSVDQLRRGGLKMFKLKSFSAPVSPNCISEINGRFNLSDQQGHDFSQSKLAIQAKQERQRCCKSVSLPTAGISVQNDFTPNVTYGYDFEPDTVQTNIFLETVVSSKAATSGQSHSSFRGTGSIEAWNEDHVQVLDDHGMPIKPTGQADRSTPTSLSPTILIASSVTTDVGLQKQKSSAPFLRHGSKKSCQFTAIPGSPQSATDPDASANEHSKAQPFTVAEANSRRKQRSYSTSSKAVKSLLIVVLAFFICMTPFSITKLYKVLFPKPDSLPGYVNLVATIFQYCSSVINPLIYGIFRRDFQKAFLLIFKRALVKLRLRDSADMNTETFLASH